MGYISVSLETDATALLDEAITYLQGQIPGLVVQTGHPLYHLLEAVVLQHAENRELVTEVLDDIAVYLGQTIHRVPLEAATQATGETTWTITGTGPRIIPVGTAITLDGGDGSRVAFVTRNEVTIPALSSSTSAGEVEIIAVDTGEQATGLQNDPQPEETFDWLDTITVIAPTIGGADGETLDAYRTRFADKMQLHADTLVLPVDYEQDARTNVDGVTRALALDLYQAALNETEELSHSASAGTFTLTVGANTTAALAWNVTAAQIKTALEGLASVGAGNTLVTGGPLPALVTIEFVSALAGTALAVSGSGASLTGGGGSASFSLVVVQDGAAGVAATEGTISVATVDDDGADPGSAIRAIGQSRQQELSVENLVVTWIAPTYTTIAVVFAAVCFSEFDPVDVQARAEAAVLEFLSPANWGLPPFGDQNVWLYSPTVRYRDVVAAIENVEGLDYTTSVTVNAGTADVTLTGAAPLPAPAPTTTAAGTVTAP